MQPETISLYYRSGSSDKVLAVHSPPFQSPAHVSKRLASIALSHVRITVPVQPPRRP